MPVTQTMALLVPIRCCDAWRTSPALTHAPRTDNARRVCCSNLVSCNCVAGYSSLASKHATSKRYRGLIGTRLVPALQTWYVKVPGSPPLMRSV